MISDYNDQIWPVLIRRLVGWAALWNVRWSNFSTEPSLTGGQNIFRLLAQHLIVLLKCDFFQQQCLHWRPFCGDRALPGGGSFGAVDGRTDRPWYNLTKKHWFQEIFKMFCMKYQHPILFNFGKGLRKWGLGVWENFIWKPFWREKGHKVRKFLAGATLEQLVVICLKFAN